ncbi:MAG: peptidoglycan DD-metalloendopeptidase family protein [Bacteroidales bacterium]|nr:peptidoglycan DD-metalloendopeptidase family protein [Bacteroidales bacterium]MBO7480270.1 peptidoglycan DD-metalloendopeptidase family protein [Bacteroidales bacterium]
MKRIALALSILLIAACGRQEMPQEPVQQLFTVVDDGHTYEYGIPVDLYSREEGSVGKGDVFSTILDRYGVPQQKSYQLAELSKDVFDVRNLQVGRDYHAYFDTTGELAYLVYEATDRKSVVFSLLDTLGASLIEKDLEVNTRYTEVEIQNSLWADIQDAGASPLLALKLSDIYAWTINFFGLQKGDSFKAVYDEYECDGSFVDIGNVYYVDFEHAGKNYECYFYEDGNESGDKYWNENGESLRKAFLKAPLSYSRISSGFSYARRHPITHQVKAHTGVDYAAPKGTPVMSIGDGVVTSVKYEGAGGNTVRITHNSVYKTAYLHLSKYGPGIKAGARVTQGQVIGYVGATGSATGPHLDFRVWKNGTPINPVTMDSPPADPVSADKMPEFEAAKARALAKRDSIEMYRLYEKLVLDPLRTAFCE